MAGNIRQNTREWSRYLWDRVKTLFSGLDTRVTALEQGGGGGGGAVSGVKGDAESTYRTGNVNLTPANIGALALSGGEMTGDIDMGQSGASSGAPRLMWKTADGTIFAIRPFNNIFQLVSYDGTNWYNVLGFGSDGSITTHYPAQFRTGISAASMTDVSARMYSLRGNIVNSGSTGTTVGYGKALVALFGQTVKVEFEAKITTAGTLNNVYDIGIGVADLRTLNSDIPSFKVLDGGIIHYFTSAGALSTSMEGYAGEANLSTTINRWNFGRLYNTSGGVGQWPDGNFTAGMIVTGSLYGKLD